MSENIFDLPTPRDEREREAMVAAFRAGYLYHPEHWSPSATARAADDFLVTTVARKHIPTPEAAP